MKIRIEIIEEFSDGDRESTLRAIDIGAFVSTKKMSVPLAQLSYLVLPTEMKVGDSIELVRIYGNREQDVLKRIDQWDREERPMLPA